MPDATYPSDPAERPPAPILRAIVVDDDLLFADLLQEEVGHILPDLVEVAVCGSPEEALTYAGEHPPDLAFIDVVFRESAVTGFELARRLHIMTPGVRIVILSAAAATGWDTTVAMGDAIQSHAVQYLKKDIRRADLLAALGRVVDGFADLPKTVADRLRNHAAEHRDDSLSPRELEVLDLIARGDTAKEVSRRLGISARTVNDYTEHARLRLGAKTTTEAVAIAVQRGLIPLQR